MTPPAKERTQQGKFRSARHHRDPPHARQAPYPGTPIEPHEQSFCLIIGVVSRHQCGKTLQFGPIPESRIARRARTFLHGRTGPEIECEACMGNSAIRADLRDGSRFGFGFGPKPMIDRGHLERSWCYRSGQQEQGQTIRPTRDCQAYWAASQTDT